MGSQGPDQGFIYKLVGLFDDQLELGGLHRSDVDAGCTAVALKRAAHYGRAPVVHDLRMAYTIFGFLDADADPELVAIRSVWFAEVGHGHHYDRRRALADRVPVESLSQTPDQLDVAYQRDWRSLIRV
jgi:hypothetical protein